MFITNEQNNFTQSIVNRQFFYSFRIFTFTHTLGCQKRTLENWHKHKIRTWVKKVSLYLHCTRLRITYVSRLWIIIWLLKLVCNSTKLKYVAQIISLKQEDLITWFSCREYIDWKLEIVANLMKLKSGVLAVHTEKQGSDDYVSWSNAAIVKFEEVVDLLMYLASYEITLDCSLDILKCKTIRNCVRNHFSTNLKNWTYLSIIQFRFSWMEGDLEHIVR